MKNLRRYGSPPYQVAVIHGGPGAPGLMAPVARELALDWGILEPLQTATSLAEQLQELHTILTTSGTCPLTLIGSSWGAMLSFIFAARYPNLIHKLILVGSGGFIAHDTVAPDVDSVMETRLSRLSTDEKNDVAQLFAALNNPANEDKNTVLAQLGQLFTERTDTYDPVTLDTEVLMVRYDIYHSVWNAAQALRDNGELLALGQHIRCPVVAIHGDYDPHPPAAIQAPLTAILSDFQFFLLAHCGHYPWIEREAKTAFFEILKRELSR